MSERTAGEVGAIMSLETVLGELEQARGRQGWTAARPGALLVHRLRHPGPGGPWSWRIGGPPRPIHLAVAEDRVIGVTPSFLGANPARDPERSAGRHQDVGGGGGARRALLSELTSSERRAR
jgi:hypothetical protein